uniref:Agenet domain-containing protein n=1 Tax=Vitis vinifera TaxID=29760 RepID=F6HZB9_VITVI
MVTEAEGLKKGEKVEVSSEEEGLRGSWYTATVLRPVTKKTKKIYVEYHTLMSEEDDSKPLRESVDAILVRPYPPREVGRRFKLMEEVDAFYSDGWWEGVVTQDFEGADRLSPGGSAAASRVGEGKLGATAGGISVVKISCSRLCSQWKLFSSFFVAMDKAAIFAADSFSWGTSAATLHVSLTALT